MRIKKYKKQLLYIIALGISVFTLFFVISVSLIGYEVKQQCLDAKKEYDGDCVDSLILLINDEDKGFRERNSAVWALGQLGDSRALPTLQSYYTGNIPKREILDKTISQYELKKAIELTSGGTNIGAWLWRNGDTK